MKGPPRRILVLSRAGVGEMMSSPGIRALNIARVLARALPAAEVTLAAPAITGLAPDAPFSMRVYTNRSLPLLLFRYDVVISQGFPPTALPACFGRRFVLDFFTNFLIEGLEYRKEHVTPGVRRAWLDTQRAYLNLQLTLADFVICANERQRDAWLGMMSCLGLIPGRVYDRDNSLRGLVDVAGYGIRPEADELQQGTSSIAPRERPALTAVFPSLRPSDTVVLWNGGVLKWYDPLTLVRAVARIVPDRPDLKLVFLGTKYPVAGFDPGATLGETLALAEELGLLGTHILFNDGWLPYDVSGQCMVEADVGVSTYFDNVETHFSYRTRMVDFLWSRTPLVCTRGDVLAQLVERRGLGLTVPEQDVDALEAALRRLLFDPAFYAQCKERLVALAPEAGWEQTLTKVVRFCADGRSIARGKWWRSPDLVSRTLCYLVARLREQQRVRRDRRSATAGLGS